MCLFIIYYFDAAALSLSFFHMHSPRQPHAVTEQLSVSSFVCYFFVSLKMSSFLPCMESTSYVLYLVTAGLRASVVGSGREST